MSDKSIEAITAGLKLLREPFPEHQISKLPKGTKAQNQCPANEKVNCQVCGGWHHPRVRHLDYVGHAALTDRLLDADPCWTWEPLAFTEQGLPRFDDQGGLWIKLRVQGMTRLGYGNAQHKEQMDVGSREKEVIGDALRNAAMRFGAALDLWHKGELHKEEPEVQHASTPKITPDPVNEEKVYNAVAWFKKMIDVDQIELHWKKAQEAWALLSNNERLAVHAQLDDIAPGSKIKYKNLLKKYLDYVPVHEEPAIERDKDE